MVSAGPGVGWVGSSLGVKATGRRPPPAFTGTQRQGHRGLLIGPRLNDDLYKSLLCLVYFPYRRRLPVQCSMDINRIHFCRLLAKELEDDHFTILFLPLIADARALIFSRSLFVHAQI